MTDTTAAPAKPTRFYDRLKAATRHRLAEPILAALCFLEAMILPIFPEIMLAPMIIADRRRAWRLAAICTVASVVGGLAGYAIGYFLFDTFGRAIIEFYGAGDTFASLQRSFNDNGALMILIGAISPIPYKVVTITSGAVGLDLWTFIVFGLIGRGLRYFVPCGLFYFFGPAANAFIERHKTVAGWAMVGLVVVGFLAAPLLFPKAGVEDVQTIVEGVTQPTDGVATDDPLATLPDAEPPS